MASSISVSYIYKTFSTVSAQMEKVSTVVKNHSDICDFKSYSITPKYSYQNNSKTLEGYQGHITFPCSFKETSQYDSVINDLNSFTKSNKLFKLTLSPIYWTLDKQTRAEVSDSLKHNIIGSTATIATAYSKSSSKDCNVRLIDFVQSSSAVYDNSPKLARSFSAEISTSAPDKDMFDIVVNATIKIICN